MSTSRLPVISQIALPKLRASLTHVLYSGVFDRRHLAPALELLAVDHALGAEVEHVLGLAFVGDDRDRVRARGRDKLHAEHAEPARRAPDQHVVAGLERMRRVAEQHAIGGRERQRVAGRLFPGEMLRLRHQLARLHAAELRERAVRRLVAPDALRGREQRIAAVAVLVVAVVLIAVDDDLVADLPALHLAADRPDDAGRVGARDVIRILVPVDRRDRLAEPGPDAVVVHARRHHEHQHLVVGDRPGRQHLDLQRGLRRPVALLADRPRVHLLRHVARAAEFRRSRRGLSARPSRGRQLHHSRHAGLPGWGRRAESVPQLILRCNRNTLHRTDKPWSQEMFPAPRCLLASCCTRRVFSSAADESSATGGDPSWSKV